MASKHEDSLVGRTFEKCRIIAKLGTGGMGSVWLAEHFGLGRKVAVKILPPEMGRDPEYVARFMREATTAGRMEHPNIVQIHDVGYAEGRHFIVMQYVDGESLSTVVDNLGAMDPKDAARIASGMLAGLQHAHDEGVVHRDVKPDNVLIAKGDEPKLLDFGLAIETETALQITKDGMVVGTPYYLAPEQARGQKATPLCDVYAAGVTLYYLVTGKRPFVGATALAVLNKHIHEPPVPPMKHRPVIPKPLNDIILKMMAKKPSDRYQSAGAAAADLEAFLKGKPVEVDIPFQLPFQLPPAISALSKKQQIIAAASAGGGLLLLLIILVIALSGGKKPPPPEAKGPTINVLPPPPVESPEGAKLKQVLLFAKEKRDEINAYPDVLNAFDVFIATTPSKDYIDRGTRERKTFADFVEKKAEDELAKRLKETDPYRRVQALRDYPVALVDTTPIEKKVREELGYALRDAETRYLQDERKIDALLEENQYSEAGSMLEALIPVAAGTRKDRLLKIKADLPQRAKDYDDETLRRLNTQYADVHKAFEESLAKRETGAAYSRVTKFLRETPAEAERQRLRVQGFNYEPLLKPFPEPVLTDAQMPARVTIGAVFTRAQNTLPFRILTDLQDAIDVEFLVRQSTAGLDALTRSNAEVQLATFNNQIGRVTIDAAGYRFVPKTGAPKAIKDYRGLQPLDVIQLAAMADGVTVEQLLSTGDTYCRSLGALWIASPFPERFAQAGRLFVRARELGLPGLDVRIDDIRERGYREVRDRIEKSRKLLGERKFEEAKQPLAGVESAWKHDPVLAAEIGRAMANILVAEVVQYEKDREWAKLKGAARTLRTKYDGLYAPEVIFAPYAHAMRQTGNWQTTGNLFNDDWTWEGKGQPGVAVPVVDETRDGRGLKLKADQSIRVAPLRSKGYSGARVSFALAKASPTASIGFRFDYSSTDGLYKKLVVRDTGEVTLYGYDGREEARLIHGSAGKKPSPGQWIQLLFVVEGGDIVCYVEDRPAFIWPLTIANNRDLELWTSAEANFRALEVRR